MKKIALIQGGLSAEKAVSKLSAKAVAKAFKALRIPYHIVECDKNIFQKLIRLKPQKVFLSVHGKYAEDGTLQGLCEYLKIPYTGSGVLASAICMDKSFFKNYMVQHKIPTPHYQNITIPKDKDFLITFQKKALGLCRIKDRKIKTVKKKPSLRSSFQNIHINLDLPFVIKPAREGSTLGIGICQKKTDILSALKKALKYDHKILVESYIKGRELAFSFLNGKVLTPVEVITKNGFYDYKSKYLSSKTKYVVPPKIDKTILEKGRKIALKAFKLCQVKTYARADFIFQKGQKPLITEVNTLPGLTQKSLLPKSAEQDGVSFHQLIKNIIEGADLDYPT